MYVYIQSEKGPDLFTVGFYDPNGKWNAESDHSKKEDAAKQTAYLNGMSQIHFGFGETMIFRRDALVDMYKRHCANEERAHELFKLAAAEHKVEWMTVHHDQACKAAGFKEGIQELFFMHDGTFEVK